MIDLVVVSIPYIMPTLPPAAPAVLKGHLESKGFSVATRDFNIKIRDMISDDQLLIKLHNYWIDETVHLTDEEKKLYDPVVEQLAQELIDLSPRWIGISVFSLNSQRFCKEFLPVLNQLKSSATRILVGGRGIEYGFVDVIANEIDCYILGDGELPLENLLAGNMSYPGINGKGEQIQDMDLLTTPDYSDYQYLDKYDHYYDGPAIQLTGSRGCVRSCSFCNVPSLWPKYQFRSGDLVADDVIKLYEQTGVRHYFFTDSLINGSVRELMKMMRKLSDYRQRTGAQITWGGQWISRKQKGLPKDYYPLIKSSGGYNLTMGIETGSDRVREHMRKGFTNEDLDAEMEQFSRHGICCGFFTFVAYPTEHREDFVDTLDMFKRYTKYVADGTLIGLVINSGFMLLPDTPISKEEGKIWIIENDHVKQWRSLVADVDYIESMHRRIIAQQVLDQLRWPANNIVYELSNFLKHTKEIAKAQRDSDIKRKDMSYLLPNYRLPDSAVPTQITIEMTGSKCREWPMVDIIINNQIVIENLIVEDQMCIRATVPSLRKKNVLKIRLKNKTPESTLVDDLGHIVEDLYVKIDSICFGEVRQRHDDLYFQGKFKNTNGEITNSNGLYHNGDLRFYFENPTLVYFINRKHKGFNERYHDRNKKVMLSLIEFYKSL